ncbi:MAG: hypothetical protein RIC38_09385 [Chromatocurvus sp.]
METTLITNATSLWAIGLSGLILLGVVLYRQYVLLQATRDQMAALQSQLDLFVDTSINVARSVDRLVNGEHSRGGSPRQASRRWLLEEAKVRLEKGEQLRNIVVPLGLSRDEVRLLHLTAGKRSNPVQHSH